MKYLKLANEIFSLLVSIPIGLIFYPIGAVCKLIIDSFKDGFNQ